MVELEEFTSPITLTVLIVFGINKLSLGSRKILNSLSPLRADSRSITTRPSF
jgi:hypothetical protein